MWKMHKDPFFSWNVHSLVDFFDLSISGSLQFAALEDGQFDVLVGDSGPSFEDHEGVVHIDSLVVEEETLQLAGFVTDHPLWPSY